MYPVKCKCGAVLGESSVEQADYGVQCPKCFESDAPKREQAAAEAELARPCTMADLYSAVPEAIEQASPAVQALHAERTSFAQQVGDVALVR